MNKVNAGFITFNSRCIQFVCSKTMSAKKKGNQLQVQKAEKATQRNEFMIRLKLFCDKVAGSSVFSLIPPAHLDDIYLLRSRPVRLDAAPGQTISPAIIKEAGSLLFLLKQKKIPFNIGNADEISLYDFFTIGLTLILYATRIKDSDYPNATIVKLKLSPLAAFDSSAEYHQFWMEFTGIMSLIGVVMCDLETGLFVLKYEARDHINGNIGMYTCMDMYCLKTEKIQVMIDGNNRTVFRLGMIDNSMQLDFVSVNSEMLDLPAGALLPVYVQSHALARLIERMDGVTKGFLHFNMYHSFKNLTICKNKKGDWLFEFIIAGIKTGYFKGDIVDGKIIVRTFLFLTNNGTPEGEKLHMHTGILKEDKMYLAIDKFSGFMNSDIKNNARVKDIFIKAGCGSLFEVDSAIFVANGTEQSLAALMENYLGL